MSYEKLSDIRIPRNQRDARIEHLRWEKRLKPLRPYLNDVSVLAGLFALSATLCALAWNFQGIFDAIN